MHKKITKSAIHAPDFLNEPVEYNKSFSRGIRVSLGGSTLLFLSGTASIDKKGNTYSPGDFIAQAGRTFLNIKALLDAQGATWHDVVQTRCYLKSMKRHYGAFNEVRNRFYKKEGLNPFPASVCIEARLCRPEFLVEIEAIAILRTEKKTASRQSRLKH